jgi:2-phosphosulfolactate phosphatase
MRSRAARSAPARLDVAFTAALLAEPERKLCVVIDVLRLTSAAVTMFGRGLREALIVATPAQARRAAKAHQGMLICGEAGGLPRGFDYGNSPVEFDQLDLRGRRAVLSTTNGTRAFVRTTGCPVVLAGALLNISAAAEAVLRLAASKRLDMTVLCAGEERGRRFSLEDAFAAGALVDRLIAVDDSMELEDSAVASLRLFRSYRRNPLLPLHHAANGRALQAFGLENDVRFCAQRDRFDVVPRLHRNGDGSLWLRPR